ncbi:MAG: Uma2 family endonuclease [Steroidobacteraceae bacterium]
MNAGLDYPRRHTVSAHEFLEMGNAGVFAPEARLELIGGEIIEMAPLGSPHATVLSELTSRLIRAAADRVIARSQCPLVLGEGSVPQPDLALLKPSPDRYFGHHPRASDALLVVEVSDTTLRFDLDSKVPLYALAGVPEAWIIDIERRAIRVFREPDAGGYRTSFTATGSDSVQPVALERAAISANALFPG